MRIHLPLHPHHFEAQPKAGPSAPPLIQLGGDLVLIELQGELSWDGDQADGVVGVLGLDRPDKPTLHLGPHHLLHGKFVNLQKPYAVIRKAVGVSSGTTLEGDSDEEIEMDDGLPSSKKQRVGQAKSDPAKGQEDHEEDEEEAPLFAADPDIFPSTPTTSKHATSSSPYYPSSAARDYSSELDPTSSPPQWEEDDDDDGEGAVAERGQREEEKSRKERSRAKRRKSEKERTRHYEVVGIVRRKVVFHLRPEPIVTATILPD